MCARIVGFGRHVARSAARGGAGASGVVGARAASRHESLRADQVEKKQSPPPTTITPVAPFSARSSPRRRRRPAGARRLLRRRATRAACRIAAIRPPRRVGWVPASAPLPPMPPWVWWGIGAPAALLHQGGAARLTTWRGCEPAPPTSCGTAPRSP